MRADIPQRTPKVLYSDFSVNLTPHPDTRQVIRVTDEAAVNRSLKNIILTDQYERPFRPNLAGNIRKTLFENISDQTSNTLKTLITKAIENHEPRVKLIDVEIKANKAGNSYTVNIYYYIIGKTQPSAYQLVLNRVR